MDYPTMYQIVLNIDTNITTKNKTIELVLRYFTILFALIHTYNVVILELEL